MDTVSEEVLLFGIVQPMLENCVCAQTIVVWEKVLGIIKALESMTHSSGFSGDLF